VKGAVLAGGAATRFGGKPKGLERVVDRVIRCLQAATGERPMVICNNEHAPEWFPGLRVVSDIQPPPPVSGRGGAAPGECGSLGGLFTAVSEAGGPVAVIAWDMPFVPVDLVVRLTKLAEGHDLALPASEGPRGVEPFCAVYAPSCVNVIRDALADEDYRATGFHDKLDAAVLELTDVAAFGDPETMFFNINTPDDLKKAEDLWRQDHG
jgi:molybdenum cofactor guanylyltransferase